MSHLLTDHLGRQVNTVHSPKRIISICPAITETLFALGLENEIIGRTKYCIFPKGVVENVQVVGDSKQVNLEMIRELQPHRSLLKKKKIQKRLCMHLKRLHLYLSWKYSQLRMLFALFKHLVFLQIGNRRLSKSYLPANHLSLSSHKYRMEMLLM